LGLGRLCKWLTFPQKQAQLQTAQVDTQTKVCKELAFRQPKTNFQPFKKTLFQRNVLMRIATFAIVSRFGQRVSAELTLSWYLFEYSMEIVADYKGLTIRKYIKDFCNQCKKVLLVVNRNRLTFRFCQLDFFVEADFSADG
jgi:hypothetical protein